MISNLAHTAGNGTASITWNTDKPADSRVDYGTSAGALSLNQSAAGLVTSHSVQLTGLAPNTTYYYRVTSTDAAANTSTEPQSPAPPASFTTPSATFTDTTVADFGAGSLDANTYVSQTEDGEVILKPAEGQEFSGGPGLPAGWEGAPWVTGGGATVSGGSLHVDNAYAATTATYTSGHVLEFKADFTGAINQHVGFGVDLNNDPNWAIFSVNKEGVFNARTNGPATVETPLSSSLLGSPHVYRIEWDPLQVLYFVDGQLVATHVADFAATHMRPIASDLNTIGPELTVDWLRMSPYPGSGTFTSRVFDAGQSANWGAISWDESLPAGSAIAISVRTGDTPTPDGSWSAFAPIGASGQDILASSRYVQYQAVLTSSDAGSTPALRDVSIAETTGSDVTPPTIVGRSPAPNATEVARDASVQVQFSELMNPATINASTLRLRKEGASADVPAGVSYSGTTATLAPSAALDPSAVYTVTVDGSVQDQAGNALGANDSWSFTTAALTVNFTDTTVSDFGAGSLDANTYVSQIEDGEVILKPTEGQEFSGGPGLPAGWSSSTWESEGGGAGGSATVSGGSLHVDGAMANTVATFGPGRSLEFVATFGLAKYQHVAFTDNFKSVWAMFSTRGSENGQLYTSTNYSGSIQDTPIGGLGQYVGSAHRYRIQWEAGQVQYFIDGALVHSDPATFLVPLNAGASDFNSGGPTLSVDWLHVSPYPASGTFTSRVFDAGQAVNWGAITWDQNAPTGTSIAISVRTGNTPTPDGTWSSFTPIATSGASIPGSSRYVQYQAQLATGDTGNTPTLKDVSIAYAVGADTPPTITGRTPAPNATGVPREGNVQVQFSEPMDPASISSSTLHLRKQGAGADVPASVSYSGTTATLTPTGALDPLSVYTVTVDGSVKDLAGNPLGANDSWSFTTAALAFTFTDTTVSDFGAGSPDANTYVSQTEDGEVILKPTEGQEFSGGPGLPTGWSSSTWESEGGGAGGSATVSGGSLHVDGAMASTEATFGPGRSLEFVATFGLAAFQHVGFSDNFKSVWALFSTRTTSGGQLYASTDYSGTSLDTPVGTPGQYIGSPHRYRIQWEAGQVQYFIDGTLVHTDTATFLVPLHVGASDFNSVARRSRSTGCT